MIVRIADDATAEVLEAARWYDAERPGLGDEFVAAVMAAGSQIATNPRAWPVWPGVGTQSPPVRRYVMRRFPFAVAFQVFDEYIEVMAVAHMRRQPGYWRGRTGK